MKRSIGEVPNKGVLTAFGRILVPLSGNSENARVFMKASLHGQH